MSRAAPSSAARTRGASEPLSAGHADLVDRHQARVAQPQPAAAEQGQDARAGAAAARAGGRRGSDSAGRGIRLRPSTRRARIPTLRRRAPERPDDPAPRRPRRRATSRPPSEAGRRSRPSRAADRGRRAAARARRRLERRRRRRGLPGHRRAHRHPRRRARRRRARGRRRRAVGPARGRLRGRRPGRRRVPGRHPGLGRRHADPERRRLRPGGGRDDPRRARARPRRRRGARAGPAPTAASPTARARSSASPGAGWCSRCASRWRPPSARRRSATPSSRGALGVEVGARAPLADVREAVLALRRGKGMVLDPGDADTVSAGSFFTNPVLDAGAFAALQARAAERLGPDAAPPAWPEADGQRQDVGRVAHRARRLPPRPRQPRGHRHLRQAHAGADQPRRRDDGRARRPRARDRRRRAGAPSASRSCPSRCSSGTTGRRPRQVIAATRRVVVSVRSSRASSAVAVEPAVAPLVERGLVEVEVRAQRDARQRRRVAGAEVVEGHARDELVAVAVAHAPGSRARPPSGRGARPARRRWRARRARWRARCSRRAARPAAARDRR